MKRNILLFITAISCVSLLCGCEGKQFSQVNSDMTNEQVFSDFVGEYPQNELSILSEGKEEIRQAINAQENLSCADNLYVNIPERASVYEFKTYSVFVPQLNYTAEQYRKDFDTFFKYFFPDREINMDYLRYYKYLGFDEEKGKYESDEGYVKDKSSLPDGVEFTYNEMPERSENWNNPIYIELNKLIGTGSGKINKGELAYLAGKTEYDAEKDEVIPSDTYNTLSDFEPRAFFESVGRYFPKSEKSFNLLDGETRICDAVEYFENYINNAPISTGLERNIRTIVYSVEVLKLTDDTYGYFYRTISQFQNVNYEFFDYGSHSTYNYDSPASGEAFMIRSNDVDYINKISLNSWTFDVNTCDKIVPVETAIKEISSSLTEGITFDVIAVELVYVRQFVKDELGHINIDTYEAFTTPAWKLTLGNSNDNRTYMGYVDAKDGKNFRYYSVPGISYYRE